MPAEPGHGWSISRSSGCGWFAAERKAWPKWDGVVHSEILPNQWEAKGLAAREWYPKVAAAEKKEREAAERAKEAEERQLAAENAAAKELEARRVAEQHYLDVRRSIASSERACLEASRRVIAQLERERTLRKKAEVNLEAALACAPPQRSSKAAIVTTLPPVEHTIFPAIPRTRR